MSQTFYIEKITQIVYNTIYDRRDSMNTLYVSDLDGTLLDSTPKTSDYTNLTIDRLNDKGIIFSYATARSYTTAKKVTKGLSIKYPMIVHNGVFIVNPDGEMLTKNVFSQADAKFILDTLLKHGIYPLVYSLVDSKEKFSYIKDKVNPQTKAFLDERKTDKRNRPVENTEQLYDGEIYYFTIIGEQSKCQPIYEMFKENFQCYSQYDMYSNAHWLEITSKSATKANAIIQLKDMLDCDNIVAFGDGINDIEMFKIADHCYAVKNAVDALKDVCTNEIDSNCSNGVARWLSHNLLGDNNV